MRKGETLMEVKELLQKEGDVGFTNWLQQAFTGEDDVKRPRWNTVLLILDIEESVSAEVIALTMGAAGHHTENEECGTNGQGTGAD